MTGHFCNLLKVCFRPPKRLSSYIGVLLLIGIFLWINLYGNRLYRKEGILGSYLGNTEISEIQFFVGFPLKYLQVREKEILHEFVNPRQNVDLEALMPVSLSGRFVQLSDFKMGLFFWENAIVDFFCGFFIALLLGKSMDMISEKQWRSIKNLSRRVKKLI